MAKITIDSINTELGPIGWKCVSTEYKNLDSELHFICDEGHDVYSSWKKIRTKPLCPACEANQFIQMDTKVVPKKGGQRILALDQSSHLTGWCVMDDGKLIKYGVFNSGAGEQQERAHKLRNWFWSMIQNWKPDYVGFEDIQFQDDSEGDRTRRMGVTVFQALARIQGVLMEACYAAGIPFEFCPTNTWRHHLGVKGKHRTDKKRSMQLIVKKNFDMTVSDDVADAIGIGKYLSDTSVKIEQWD